MMIDPPILELLEKVDCLYTLAVASSKRARELIGDTTKNMKDKALFVTNDPNPLSVAIEEINRGLITYSRDSSKTEEDI